MAGQVLEIWTAPEAGASMKMHDSIPAEAGLGLAGDRYACQESGGAPDRELTLIAQESLDWLHQTHGISMTAADSRRNILVTGISLNPLVGQRFHIGRVEVEGMRLCQPCKQLATILGFDFAHLMLNRAGLNCRILNSGTISVGDVVDAPHEE